MSARSLLSAFSKTPLSCALGLLLAFGSGASQAAADLPTLLGKNPAMFDLKLSPDGQHLAAKVKKDNRDILVFFDTASMKPVGSFRLRGAHQVGEYHWVNDERVVFKVTEVKPWEKTPHYYGELFGVNVDGSRSGMLFGYRAGEMQAGSNLKKRESKYAWAEFIDLQPDEKNRILIRSTPMSDDGERLPEVLAMDIYNGKTMFRGKVPVPHANILPDTNGRPLLAAGDNLKDQREVYLRTADSDDWKKLPEQKYGGTFSPIAVSTDNKSVYVFDNPNENLTGVHKLELSTLKYSPVYTDAKVDVTSALRSTDRRSVYGMRVDDGVPTYLLFTAEFEEAKIFKELLGAFPGHDVELTSGTRDGKKWTVRVSSDINPGTFYLYDHEKARLSRLTDLHPQLKDLPLATTEPIEFAAADGYQLHGYLTKAPQQSAEKPLVVLVHGGPHNVRDYWGFNNEVQLLAMSGYNVLQVNFRGSGGYGGAHQSAGYQQWGGLIQQDIIDGTKWAIAQGHGKSGNVCIMGFSFGGYSAVQAPTLAPGLYKCGVAVGGIYDLSLMTEEGDIAKRSIGQAYLKRAVGDDPAKIAAFSPVRQVSKLNTHLLVMHGKRDERAPIIHAERLKAALDQAGKPYEWYLFDDEAHGFYDEQNQQTYLRKIQQYLGTQLKI